MTGLRTDADRIGQAGHRVAARRAGRVLVAVVLGAVATVVPGATEARAGGFASGTRQVSLEILAGSAQPVSSMADYQWEVRPQAAWGAQALAGLGPIAAGLRWWRSGTTQALGLSGQPEAAVRTNSFELVARARVVAWHGLALHATAAGGRLAMSWDPDHVTVATGGTPVEVELAPIHEWVGGAGLALEAPLSGDWSLGLEGERRVYALDTAHRSGSGVEYARETFGDWAARLSLCRTWRW